MLSNILPENVLEEPERGLREIMRAVIMRPNFIPGTRYRIGWRGLKDSSVTDRQPAWTARIAGLPGVTGLAFDRFFQTGDWTLGRFELYYFPAVREDRADGLSIAALAFAEADSYPEMIRDFLRHREFSHHFLTGTVTLALHRSGRGIALGLKALTRQRTIAIEGISIPRDGGDILLVEPGGFDMDFPAFETALPFYEVLAASFSFTLGEPPVLLEQRTAPGKTWAFDRAGAFEERHSPDACTERLVLFWGREGQEEASRVLLQEDEAVLERTIWKSGLPLPGSFKDRKWWTAHREGDSLSLDKKTLGMADRPDLIILTGFLGAGKTTFLRHFIEYEVQRNRFIAVIQNEIGKTGLDGKLLDHDYAVTEVDEGCVCCSLAGSLKRGIHDLLGRFHPDVVVLETTGLANPNNLREELIELREIVTFDSVVTVVDGINIEDTLKRFAVAREQIEGADVLLLNKTDLLTSEKILELEDTLRKLNPGAPVLPVRNGDVNPALLFGPDLRTARQEKSGDTVALPTLSMFGKGPSHRTDGLASLKIPLDRPVDRESLLAYLSNLPPSVFRIKGIIDFRQEDAPSLLQYVAGRCEITPFAHPSFNERFLIVIGRDVEEIARRGPW